MGTKLEISTAEGMRRMLHEQIDLFFAGLKTKEDGTPVDDVRFRHEKDTRVTEYGALITGKLLGIEVRYRKPEIHLAPGKGPVLFTRDGRFVLADPTPGTVNALIRYLLDTHENNIDEERALEMISTGQPFSTDRTIAEIATMTNLLFQPYDTEKWPESVEPEVKPVPAEQLSTEIRQDVVDEENRKFAEDLQAAAKETEVEED